MSKIAAARNTPANVQAIQCIELYSAVQANQNLNSEVSIDAAAMYLWKEYELT